MSQKRRLSLPPPECRCLDSSIVLCFGCHSCAVSWAQVPSRLDCGSSPRLTPWPDRRVTLWPVLQILALPGLKASLVLTLMEQSRKLLYRPTLLSGWPLLGPHQDWST